MVMARLAQAFADNPDNLYKAPEELAEATQVGNREQWQALLLLEPTQGYIKGQMAQVTQVAARKGLMHLQTQAKAGNVQAVKQIYELSGILAQEESNKTVVLHQISRPKTKEATVNGPHSDDDATADGSRP